MNDFGWKGARNLFPFAGRKEVTAVTDRVCLLNINLMFEMSSCTY